MFVWHLLTGKGIMRLKKILKEYNIRLIYCADNLSKLIGGIAGKMAEIKVVAHCHDDFKEDSLGKIMRIFYLLLLDKILTVSDKVRRFFTVKGEISPKAITVYNGINADYYNPQSIDNGIRGELGLDSKTFVIGSIGVLEKDKGQKYLLEAISLLKSKGIDDIVCLICGVGPEETYLKGIVEKMGLASEVLFLGFRNDIPRILKILDVLVITSLTIESFSMVAAEAMAMRVPVIATNIGGLPEVIEDRKTGILVPQGDTNALLNALEYLIKNSDMRKEMGEEGRKRVLKYFTIQENVRRTEEIFLHLIKADY
jgi:glycosyltransferase involved in cell wall biosynthesis